MASYAKATAWAATIAALLLASFFWLAGLLATGDQPSLLIAVTMPLAVNAVGWVLLWRRAFAPSIAINGLPILAAAVMIISAAIRGL